MSSARTRPSGTRRTHPQRTLALTDFVGIAVHCAQGAALCNTPNAKPDDATIVPGSDNGYKALFGAKYVNPAINNGQVRQGNRRHGHHRLAGNCGFPGFDGALAKNTLGEVAQMQENGVPVTFAYISDAHDNHTLGRASGPGEADYQAQLKSYDDAFTTFFQRLRTTASTRRTRSSSSPSTKATTSPAGRDPRPGETRRARLQPHTCLTPTSCPANQIGEVNANINSALPAAASFDVHFDDAPTFYVNGRRTGRHRRCGSSNRRRRRNAARPVQGGAQSPIALRLADTVEENALHMVNSDPKRTPWFTMFGDDDFFFQIGNVCRHIPRYGRARVRQPELRVEPR